MAVDKHLRLNQIHQADKVSSLRRFQFDKVAIEVQPHHIGSAAHAILRTQLARSVILGNLVVGVCVVIGSHDQDCIFKPCLLGVSANSRNSINSPSLPAHSPEWMLPITRILRRSSSAPGWYGGLAAYRCCHGSVFDSPSEFVQLDVRSPLGEHFKHGNNFSGR